MNRLLTLLAAAPLFCSGCAQRSEAVSLSEPAAAAQIASSPDAHEVETPRTRTLPGIGSPAFPYAAPEDVGLSTEKLNKFGDEIAAWAAKGDFVGGELLIIKDRKTIFHEAYGWSDREARRPMQRNSIFSVKSMSKPVTATAILMLADEGKLSLGDPVSRYVSTMPDDRITIGHLLAHTSGYSGDEPNPLEPELLHDSLPELALNWAKLGPTRPLGEMNYSDFNYVTLGYIVGSVSGIPIGEFTETRIAQRLGMSDTSTHFTSDPAWRARLNPWYIWNKERGGYDLRHPVSRRGWPFYLASWGMFSTAMDYSRFVQIWLEEGKWHEKRILSKPFVQQALQEHGRDKWGAYGYGWGLEQTSKGRPPFFYHQGGDGTFGDGFALSERCRRFPDAFAGRPLHRDCLRCPSSFVVRAQGRAGPERNSDTRGRSHARMRALSCAANKAYVGRIAESPLSTQSGH